MADLTITLQGVSIPANTSGTLYVYEDVGGDGSGPNSVTVGGTTINYENVDSVALADADTDYTLSGFDGGASNDFYPRVELDNTDDVSAAELTEAMDIQAAAVTATVGAAATVDLSATDAGGTGTGTATAAVGSPASVDLQALDAGASNDPTFVTALPDAQAPTSDASVEDELTISWTDVTDYGTYDLQLRESNEGAAWGSTADITVGQDVDNRTVTGLEDGEGYDIRLRTRTEHITGAWVEITDVTLLPAPGSVATANVGTNSLDVTWTDTADNEDGIRVERRRQYSGGFGPYSEVADLAPNSTSYTDSAVVPGTTYEYRVENYTEHVTASDTVQVTTTAGAPQDTTPERSGWYVELTASDGSTRTFTSDGDPERDPSLKDLERVTVTVGKDESWDADKWEDASARVWQNGYRLPVDTLVSRNQRPGQTQLVIEGPAELHETNQYEFSNTDVHAAFATVMDDTSIPYTVVSPSADNREFDSVSTNPGFLDYYQDPGPNTNIGVQNDALELLQSCWWVEGEDEAANSTDNADFSGGDPQWSNGEATDLVLAGSLSFTITPDYTIPASDLTLVSRLSTDNFSGDLYVEIDGTRVSELVFETINITSTLQEHTAGLASGVSEDFDDTQHTITIGVEQNSEGDLLGSCYIDGTAIYDGQYHNHSNWSMDTWDTSVYYNDPPLYEPDGTNALLLHNGFLSATGARFEGTFNDTSGDHAIALSNDDGNTYTTAANTGTLETDFGSGSPDITARITLDAYGSRQVDTPLQNYQGQRLTDYTLDIDTRDSPPLDNTAMSGDYKDILTQLVNRGNILWAAEWTDGQIEIRMANVADLTSARDLDLVEYEWDTQTLGKQITWATIDGGAQPVEGEQVTLSAESNIQLARDDLVSGREQVRNPTTGTVYTRGTDYTMNYVIGTIARNNGGNIPDNTTVEVDYEWKPEGEYSSGAADEKTRLRDTFVNAVNDTQCQAIAYYLVQKLKDPVIGGTATVDAVPPAMSLLDVFAADPVPSDVTDSFYVQSGSVTEGQATFTIESRRPRGELIGQINNALGDVQDRV